MIKISGVTDDLLDPAGEPGDASVDAIVVWTPATFAPTHDTGQKPATRRLLTHQGTTRVSLTERGNVKGAGCEIFNVSTGRNDHSTDKADDLMII